MTDMTFPKRLWAMFIGWGSVGVIYSISGSRPAADAHFLYPGAIDRWFSFNPDAIWVYMSFFIIIPMGYLMSHADRVRWLCRAMVFAAAGAGAAYAMYPTTMAFPPVTQMGISADALRYLMHFDTMVNCAPSLHVALTFLAIIALWDGNRPWRNAVFCGWGAAIAVSILVLHRHQFIDGVTGLALGICAAVLSQVFNHKRRGANG